MAANRIGYDDIFDPKAIDTAISEIKRLQDQLNAVSSELKEIVSTSSQLAQSSGKAFGNASDIKKTEEAINDVLKASEDLNNVQKAQEDLEKRMSKLLNKRAEHIADLEVQVVKLKEEQKKLREEEKKGIKTAEQVAREKSKLQNQIKLTQKAISEERKALIESTKEQEANTKNISKAQKIRQQLKDLTTEQAKEEAILAERLSQQKKELRETAKEALATDKTYRKLVKATNEAQKEFKEAAVAYGLNSKEAREAEKAFKNLDDQLREVNDAAKDGRRDVGRYRIAVQKLNGVLAKMGAATGVIALLSKLFEGFQNVMGNNSDATATFEKILGRVTVTFTVLLSRITKGLPIIKDLFFSVFNDISGWVKSLTLELKIFGAESLDVFGQNKEEIKALKDELANLNTETSKTGDAWEDLTKVFEGTGEEIANTIDKNDKLIDSTLSYRKQIIALQKDINKNLGLQAELQAAAENENNSLLDRIENQEELIRITDYIQQQEIAQAKLREDLARQNAEIFDKSLDAQEEYQNAVNERVAAEITAEQELLAHKRELQTLERDQLEQELDFLIDNFDNQKTINERIIADETKTFEERERLLKENQRLAAESFAAQIDLFNARAQRMGKAQLDLEALVNESDSRVIAQQAKNAGISEALLVRVLEVIRERRTVTQDLVETQKDLNEASTESNKLEQETAVNLETVKKLKEEGVDVEKVLEELERKRLEQTIENLKKQIALLDENSEKRIELENELSQALLDQQIMRLDKEAQEEAKAAERRVEIQEAAATTIEKFAEKMHEKRLKRIDDELNAQKEREDELRELARRGIQDANENLAENQKRQAELEKQREKELKRQKQFELALAAARAYSANVAAGEKNPLAKTITDVALLEAFVESLTGFYHGTEDTGNKGVISDEYGVITGYTHANERVLTAEQNAALPSISNWELVRMANMTQDTTIDHSILNGLRDVKNAIEQKPVYLGRGYDATERAITDTYQERGKLLRRHFKRGGLISKRR